MQDCIFCKIIAKQIAADVVYEDDLILAFKDINPRAQVHILVIPKKHITSLQTVTDNDRALLGHLSCKLGEIANSLNLATGFKIIVNNGSAAKQEVPHLHYHLLAGNIKTL